MSEENAPFGDTIIGNDRFAKIEYGAGADTGVNIGAQIDPGTEGRFSYTNDATTWGILTLRYGDSGTLNLVDPVNYQFTRVNVFAVTPGTAANLGDNIFQLNVTATDTTSNSSTQSQFITNAGNYDFAYGSFSGVDFTSIDTITYEFVSLNVGAGITLDAITREIPEPASLALLGLGGMLLISRRRKV